MPCRPEGGAPIPRVAERFRDSYPPFTSDSLVEVIERAVVVADVVVDDVEDNANPLAWHASTKARSEAGSPYAEPARRRTKGCSPRSIGTELLDRQQLDGVEAEFPDVPILVIQLSERGHPVLRDQPISPARERADVALIVMRSSKPGVEKGRQF